MIKVTLVILCVSVPIAKNITTAAREASQSTFPVAAPASRAVLLYKNLARAERLNILQSFQVLTFDCLRSFFTLQFHAVPRQVGQALHNKAQAAVEVCSRFQAVNSDRCSNGEWTDILFWSVHTGFLTGRCVAILLGKNTSPDALPVSLRLLRKTLGAEVIGPCRSKKSRILQCMAQCLLAPCAVPASMRVPLSRIALHCEPASCLQV